MLRNFNPVQSSYPRSIFKSIKNSQTANNSKVIPRGTGTSPLTRFKRELFAFPLQLYLCYQICNTVKASTSLHIWCSTGMCMFAKNYGKSEQSFFTSFQRVMYSSSSDISALTCLSGLGKPRGCLGWRTQLTPLVWWRWRSRDASSTWIRLFAWEHRGSEFE